eukprot:scaffold7346_cov245-Pinguiococcus_pyrenoidosus.AAC.43
MHRDEDTDAQVIAGALLRGERVCASTRGICLSSANPDLDILGAVCSGVEAKWHRLDCNALRGAQLGESLLRVEVLKVSTFVRQEYETCAAEPSAPFPGNTRQKEATVFPQQAIDGLDKGLNGIQLGQHAVAHEDDLPKTRMGIIQSAPGAGRTPSTYTGGSSAASFTPQSCCCTRTLPPRLATAAEFRSTFWARNSSSCP